MQEEIKSLKSILKNTEAQLQELQRSAAENSEVLEMATLDREMAEERCEVLQLELDSLKERQEELDTLLDLFSELCEITPESMKKEAEKLLRHVQLALPNLLAFCPDLDAVQEQASRQLGGAAA